MSDFKEAQEGAKQQALRQLMQTADSDTGWLSDMPKVSAEEEDFPTTVFILAEESHAIGSIDVAQAINEVWEIFETFYDSTYKAQTSLLQKQMKDLLEELRDLSFVNGELSRENESLKAEAWEAKRKEIGRGISPAGIKREAGLTSALTTLGISVEEENE